MRYILSKTIHKFIAYTTLIIAIITMVTGCDDEKPRVQAVQKYIDQLKQDAQKSKQPVAEVTLQFPTNAVYGESPTNKATNSEKPTKSGYINPLQAYATNKYQFVGVLEDNDHLSAYILAPDGMVYQVKEGDAIGDNYGKISKIDSDHLTVIEQTTGKNNKVEQQSITLELKDDKDDQTQS